MTDDIQSIFHKTDFKGVVFGCDDRDLGSAACTINATTEGQMSLEGMLSMCGLMERLAESVGAIMSMTLGRSNE